jgi:hypothetical protein
VLFFFIAAIYKLCIKWLINLWIRRIMG